MVSSKLDLRRPQMGHSMPADQKKLQNLTHPLDFDET